MKTELMITDRYDFDTNKPSHSEVESKREELKAKGWTKLEFEEGWHWGPDPSGEEYDRPATFIGIRAATKGDIAKKIKEHKKSLKIIRKDIKQTRKEKQAAMARFDADIMSLTKALLVHKNEIAELEGAE